MPDADAPLAGFFGKLPSTGDFVSRGLPDGFRQRWDHWVTRHLAARRAGWPEGGLRFRLISGGWVAAGVIVPSADRVGRRFPLSLVVTGRDLPGPEALEPWCAAAAGLATEAAPDDFWAALADLPCPEGAGPQDAFLLWTAGRPAAAADPATPEAVLDALWQPPAP